MIHSRGLVGSWRLENTALDGSGNGRHGTLHGNVTYTAGRLGRCLNFGGTTSDYMACGSNPILGSSPLTLAAWLNMADQASWGLAVKIGSSLDEFDAYAYLGNHAGTERVGGGLGGRPLDSGISALGVWQHAALTYAGGAGGAMRLYVAGVLRASTTVTANLASTQITLGRLDAKYPYQGLLDEVHIWNRALTETDIRRVMLGLHPLT